MAGARKGKRPVTDARSGGGRRGATEGGRAETSASGMREDVGVRDEGEVVEEGEEGVICEGVLGLRWGYFFAKLGGQNSKFHTFCKTSFLLFLITTRLSD